MENQEAINQAKMLDKGLSACAHKSMENHEAVRQDDAIIESCWRRGAWQRRFCDYINPLVTRIKRRPLFQKVVIANTLLIAIGSSSAWYFHELDHSYLLFLQDAEWSFFALFVGSYVFSSILINYVLVRLAFRPLDDVTETMKAIRAGRRKIRVPEITDDPQIEELSKTLNSMLNSMERQRKRAAASVIKAQEEERKRIARELHDETSQSLTSLAIGIKMVEEVVPESMTDIRERLRNISELAHSTLNEVHTMAVRLRPSVLDDLGLQAALRSYVKEFSRNTGIEADLSMLAMSERLPAELETVLYRVVQEALTNIARHSGAEKCCIALHRRDGVVLGAISDNGRGFDPQAAMLSESGRGLGLHGMKERIELLGGSLEFDSRPDEGATIFLEAPVEPKEGIW